MAAYREVSWKRNIRKIPEGLRLKIGEIQESSLVVVCIKPIKLADIEQGMYDHIGINVKKGRVSFVESILPPADMGPFSAKNAEGWEVKRTDLPMIKKNIHLGDRPIYGDWSNGSFSLWSERDVYQREFHEPRDYMIHVDLIKEADEKSPIYVFKFQIGVVLDKSSSDFDEDLLFCLNVLQENVGNCDVESSQKTRDDFISTIVVDWEIFPPGSLENFISKFKSRLGKLSGDQERIVTERVKEFSKLKPEAYIQGKGGFNYYIGAKISDNLVVFENIRYGNALYVLYESWESVSKRSRTDLIRGTDADFERIPHVDGWEEQLRAAVRKKRSKR